MDIEELRAYILQKPDVTEGFPFGEDTLVFKVNGKIFLLTGLDSSPLQFNVKCDPDRAIELREEFPDSILPGFHMNKKHWNTVVVDGSVSKKILKEMIDHSYDLVSKKKK
jgi:predicted DNA-binding protein (MmcQ/YjbR family)